MRRKGKHLEVEIEKTLSTEEKRKNDWNRKQTMRKEGKQGRQEMSQMSGQDREGNTR